MHILSHLVTTTWAGKFRPTGAPDEYKIKIFVGGGKEEGPAAQKAVRQAEKFMPAKGYAYYTIVNSSYRWLWTAWEFTVQFRRP